MMLWTRARAGSHEGLRPRQHQTPHRRVAHCGRLHIVVGTLACRGIDHLTSLIAHCWKPSRSEHGRSIVTQKTRRGSLQRTADMASGAFASFLNIMVGQLACAGTLKASGLSTPETESPTLRIVVRDRHGPQHLAITMPVLGDTSGVG